MPTAVSCSLVVPITSLAPAPFVLKKDIQVVVEPSGEEYLASFFDANINASGDTETEAVANLKDIMINVFQYLLDHPAKNLGPRPRAQLAVLNEFIEKRA